MIILTKKKKLFKKVAEKSNIVMTFMATMTFMFVYGNFWQQPYTYLEKKKNTFTWNQMFRFFQPFPFPLDLGEAWQS